MRISEALEEGLLRSRDRNAARGGAESQGGSHDHSGIYSEPLVLIANAQHEGLSEAEIIGLPREAIDTVLDSLVRNKTVYKPAL